MTSPTNPTPPNPPPHSPTDVTTPITAPVTTPVDVTAYVDVTAEVTTIGTGVGAEADGDEPTGFILWQVTLAWQRAIRDTLDPHDLTHVQYVLLASAASLAHDGEAPTQHEIADHAGTDPVLTGQVLRRLAARQLISRDLHESDTHARRITLTESGQALLTEAKSDLEAADQDFFLPLHTTKPVLHQALTTLRTHHHQP